MRYDAAGPAAPVLPEGARMPSPARIAALACLLAFALPSPARAGDEIPADVRALRECIARNVPAQGRQRLRLERTDASNATRRLEATALWKLDDAGRSRLLVRIEEPPAERGSAFLLLAREGGNDLWTYVPELRAVRRISGRAVSGSFFASDFTYEDVIELQAQAPHARVERLPDAVVDGRAVRVIAATPDPTSGSEYGRVVSSVDPETCVVLRLDLDARSGERIKEAIVAPADVERQGERWRPRRVTMRDLRKGSTSTLVFEAGEWNVEIPERSLDPNELAKGR